MSVATDCADIAAGRVWLIVVLQQLVQDGPRITGVWGKLGTVAELMGEGIEWRELGAGFEVRVGCEVACGPTREAAAANMVARCSAVLRTDPIFAAENGEILRERGM